MNAYEKAESIAEKLIAAHDRGESISSMAKEHGLRREAIATVLAAHGRGKPSAAREAVLEYVRANPGLSVDDLALRLDLSKSSVSRYLRGSAEARLVVARKQSDLSTFTDAEMAAALRSAFAKVPDKAKGISRVRYNKLKDEGAPAASTFIRRYGAWSVACEKAGVSASKPRRGDYRQEWSDEQILDAVDEYISSTGETAYHGYAAWAKQHGRPSGPLLVVRFGGWAEARREVIRRASQRPSTVEVA